MRQTKGAAGVTLVAGGTVVGGAAAPPADCVATVVAAPAGAPAVAEVVTGGCDPFCGSDGEVALLESHADAGNSSRAANAIEGVFIAMHYRLACPAARSAAAAKLIAAHGHSGLSARPPTVLLLGKRVASFQSNA